MDLSGEKKMEGESQPPTKATNTRADEDAKLDDEGDLWDFHEESVGVLERDAAHLLRSRDEPENAVTREGPFDGNEVVRLFCEEGSLVWKHKTLYTLAKRVDLEDGVFRSRLWVTWKREKSDVEEGKVPVFVRPKDWRRDERKIRLRALSGKQSSWRSFQVCDDDSISSTKRRKVVFGTDTAELREALSVALHDAVPAMVEAVLSRLVDKP